jgi:hypothetical protein
MSTHTQPTQANVILAELEKNIGQWVPMPHLARISGAYAVHSRIAELRKRGHSIGTHVKNVGHLKHSFYRLSL